MEFRQWNLLFMHINIEGHADAPEIVISVMRVNKKHSIVWSGIVRPTVHAHSRDSESPRIIMTLNVYGINILEFRYFWP